MQKTTTLVAALLFAVGMLAPLSQVAAQERVVVEERNAEVLRVIGRTVVIRNDKGEIKKFTELPENLKLFVDDQPAKLSDLKQGMKLHGVRFENVPAPVTVTYEEVQEMESAPAPAPAPAPAQLPKTASGLPMVGLAGLLLTLFGGGALLRRRRA